MTPRNQIKNCAFSVSVCSSHFIFSLSVYISSLLLFLLFSTTMEDPSAATTLLLNSEYSRLFVEDTDLYNRIVLGTLLPHFVWGPLPHFLQTWLRNYLGGVLLYLLSGLLWCFYIYYWKRNVYVPKGFTLSFSTLRFFMCVCFFLLRRLSLAEGISLFCTFFNAMN